MQNHKFRTINDEVVSNVISQRSQNSYKYNYGRVLIIGGNKNFGGAIIMSTAAAVNSGAGLVTVFSDPINLNSLHSVVPEAVFYDYYDQDSLINELKKATVVTIGSGLGTDKQALHLLKTVFQFINPSQILLIDGSAFTLLAESKIELPKAKVILTPHEGEWTRFSGLKQVDHTPENNQIFLEEISKYPILLVLKKHRTEIYLSNQMWKNPTGNASMATAGMGDTLAGMIAGFCAQFPDYLLSTCAAVYLHGSIGDNLHQKLFVTIPSEITKNISSTMRKYEML